MEAAAAPLKTSGVGPTAKASLPEKPTLACHRWRTDVGVAERLSPDKDGVGAPPETA